MNSLKTIVAALVAGTTVAISMPMMANADTAVVQQNTQTSVVTGNNNAVKSTSVQTNRTVTTGRSNRSSGDIGVVQINDQLTDVMGDNNSVTTKNTQQNVIRTNRAKVKY
ncbi:MAG: hypothetical protein DCF20_05410 [Pseudanabaena sp.]|nr:MAG: hypothetical protein DCF20_05410 [Pseudanabaena sp.]